MRLAVDARELSGRPTGVGRYLGGLLRSWSAEAASHGHELLVYAPAPLGATLGPRARLRLLPGTGGTVWEQRALPAALRADGVDVLFSPAYSTPLLTRVPRVLALHDLSFVARPDWFAWREGLRRRWLARLGASAARAVITISEFSRGEIERRLGVEPAKIHVIPPGIDVPRATRPAAADGQVHLLYVGSIFNRRHIPELIAAFDQVAARHADAVLHIVGDNRSHPAQDIGALIAASGARARVHWHRYVDDDALARLFGAARGFVFLSEYEGLGLTPLEALSVGIPSVLLDTAVARESCGDAACYVRLADRGAVAAALETVLFDDDRRTRLLAEGPAVLDRYDWEQASSRTLRVLEEAAG
jgi:glycosyltransferase involved in cell wall biosynthesis